MRILGSSKSCATGNRLSVTFKAHPNSQPQLNDLRKNLNDKIRFREYVKNIIGNEEQMGSVLDTISSTQEEERLATVTGWSTVNIANCAGVSNSSIYLALKWVLMPIKVEIFNFKRSGPEDKMARGQFLVDNLLCANRLKRLQQEVAILYTCQKIEVSVTPGLPKSVMNAQILEGFSTAVKTAIKVRYDLATRTLDLSRFHACPELGKLFCPLHVVNLLQSVLALSSQLFPQMAGIVLSNNYLCSLKAFAGVSNSLASLERLDISANRIKDLGELNYLGNLKLKTLFVAGNGLAKLKLGDIQEVLPQLQNVHGCVYSEEKEEVIANLPVYQRLQDSGTKGMQLCINFISSFYNSFDEPEKRSQLKDYYHEQAMFSLSLPVQLDHVYAYKLYNRNQRRQQSSFAHNAKLQVGSASLLLALSRLPLMQTDHQNAGLDIHVFNANLRIFTLSGYFKEITSDGWERRHFQRTFVLRLINSPGWLITNDMLCITSIKSEQREPVKFQPNTDTSVKKPVCRQLITDASVTKTVNPVKGLVIKTKPQKKDPPVLRHSVEVDPLNQAIQNISLMDAKMDLLPDESLDEMPPLVAIGPLNTNQADLLDQVIEDTLMSDEDAFDLVIDEDVLIGDDDL
ncbi:nuclear RNA export factor 1 [Drosophila gunungcola]|uniref:nuclear RNA export factor 1 n=1 Tax=Drosophila gunungcola TaxID=103775 RepID=UPI0022E34220|nr:nuclear RNA export factor 1 [Drosophila gunungcola]